MEWDNNIPEWKNTGTEPSEDRKEKGFEAGYKPPAGIFNWLYSLILRAVKELQTKFGSHADNKENPHGVTATQLGLDKVNNTSDAEKSVKFASEAGVGRKVQHALTVRFNGGREEGTDVWTYDGSTSRSVNITPEKIGAANATHEHTLGDVTETTEKKYYRVVEATSTDGTTYTATIADVTELFNGMRITIIPNMNNVSLSPRLVINSKFDNGIRLAHSFNYAATNALKTNFLQVGRPVELKYDANCNLGIQGQGAWIFTDRVKTSAQDLYGTVPIESGGTDANNAEDARENLNVAKTFAHPAYSSPTKQLSELGYYYIEATIDDAFQIVFGVVYNSGFEVTAGAFYDSLVIQLTISTTGALSLKYRDISTDTLSEPETWACYVSRIGNFN